MFEELISILQNHPNSVFVSLAEATKQIEYCLQNGEKILICGNGGSNAEASHLTAEIVGRFVRERRGYPAVCLNEASVITAIANDYGYKDVFARQIEALGEVGDIFIIFSTSGNSENVNRALVAANYKGMTTIAFLGRDGGSCKDIADVSIIAPAHTTALIQELHLVYLHEICRLLDNLLD